METIPLLAIADASAVIDTNAGGWEAGFTRRLQQQNETQEQTESPSNPCSICQGLEIIKDLVPGRDSWMSHETNETCAERNEFYEVSQASTSNISCRYDPLFNNYFDACCLAPLQTYECEHNVRTLIPPEDYDTLVPPIIGRAPNQKLDVNVRLVFDELKDISAEEGTATIGMTITLLWNDPRLEWNIDTETCANRINARAAFDGTTSIWVPDYDLANKIEGFRSFPTTQAEIYSDGTVSWQISGSLKAFCGYKGLGAIPFDTLGCQLIFVPTSRFTNDLIHYKIYNPQNVTYTGFDAKYDDFVKVKELGEIGYTLDGIGIYYNIYFKRASKTYVQNIVIPTLLLTCLSFFSFFLDVRVGERLGFSLTIALVVVAQQILTSELTPVSSNRLWLQYFTMASFYFVLVGVIQSVIIGFLFFVRKDRRGDNRASYRNVRQEDDDDEQADTKFTTTKSTPHVRDDEDEEEASSRIGMKPDTSHSQPKKALLSSPNHEIPVENKKFSWKDSCLAYFLYSCPLRRLDMITFGIVLISYVGFVTFMFASKNTDFWLNDEPYWFDESSSIVDYWSVYPNKDPSN